MKNAWTEKRRIELSKQLWDFFSKYHGTKTIGDHLEEMSPELKDYFLGFYVHSSECCHEEGTFQLNFEYSAMPPEIPIYARNVDGQLQEYKREQ